ncbi:MAG: alpha/beta fold hydrolase [Paracoccaceae bacterium]
MPSLSLGTEDAISYDYAPPADGVTFVFFNALTGDRAMWAGVIAETLHAAGHGTLAWNMRGQAESPFTAGTRLDEALIVADARALLAHVDPPRPMLVGLSIGGLFAARTMLAGAEALGLVLINTVRRDCARLRWVNDAIVRCAEVGGLELFRDLFCPLLFNEAWLAENRGSFLGKRKYAPIDRVSGHYALLIGGGGAEWDLPYEDLRVPVLVVTGLQDRVFLDDADVEALAARIPRVARVNMADAGHMLPAERPEALAGALIDFAGRLRG